MQLELHLEFLIHPYDFGPAKHLSELSILPWTLLAPSTPSSTRNARPARTRKDAHVLQATYTTVRDATREMLQGFGG